MSEETAGHGRPVDEELATIETHTEVQTPIDSSRLTDFLPDMAAKWLEIGLKLGCKNTVMQLRISAETLETRCFLLIEEWINRGENACWEYLCRNVLRSKGVGLARIADQIEQVL